MAVHLTGENRACLVRIPADRDDRLDIAIEKFVHVFRGVRGNVDADLGEYGDRFGMHIARGIGARTVHLEDVTRRGAKDSLGHVAAAGIPRAKNENARFVTHGCALIALPERIGTVARRCDRKTRP